jgi:hypothetical protein
MSRLAVALLAACCATTAHAETKNIDQVRKDFAQMVYADSAAEINRDAPQPLLRAVVVLRVRLNEAGHWAAEVMRDNNLEPSLTRKAVASVEHLATPANVPEPLVEQLHRDGFVEVWLFQNDSHFALKTLALPQRGR